MSVRQAFRERPLLDRLQVFARQADVQATVFLERGLSETRIARSLALAGAGGLPLAPLDGLQQLLLAASSSWLGLLTGYSFVAFRLGMSVFRKTACSSSTSGTKHT